MKNRVLILAGLFIFSLAAIWAYKSNYELRLVPNKPDLRPKAVQPSPQELNPNFQLSGGSERDTRGFPQRKIVDLSSMFPGLFYLSGDRHEKKVALTFDDGPDSVYTPQILDILKENGVKATFFLIGNRANLFPEMVKRIIQEGHVVGNHSMTHPDIMKLDKTQTKDEIFHCEEALAKLIGYKTALFRSPYGSLDPDKVKEIKEYNYKIIAWNVDSLDWESLSAEQVKKNILENVKSGSIILQHSSGSTQENLSGTVSALGDVIKTLKQEGYQFITVPELLNIPKEKS